MEYRSTREVAKLLGVSPSRLARAVWDGRVSAPEKAPNGAYLWKVEDIQRAAWQFLGHGLSDIT